MVVAWDTPGCGASFRPAGALPHGRVPAECLTAFLDARGMQRVPCGRALMGLRPCSGAVPPASGRGEKPRVGGGPYAGWAGSLPPDEVEQRLQFALRVVDLAPGRFEPASMAGLFSDAMPPAVAAELSTIMSEIRPAGTRAMAHALAEADLRDVLPEINVPTLVLAGDADERSPLSVARALHASIPHSTLTVMPGLGHECYLESAETFDRAVRDFLHTVSI